MQFYSSSRVNLSRVACTESPTNRSPELLEPFVYPRSTIGRVLAGQRSLFFCNGNKGKPDIIIIACRTRKFVRISPFVVALEFHLRNNIPRISFVEIHSPLWGECITKVSQQRIVSRLANE